MDNNKDIVHFTLNNWMVGEDYPPGEPFATWMSQYTLCNDAWCKEQKICVYYGNIDMSVNYAVTATREWVEKNCPKLLTDDSYTYTEIICRGYSLKEVKEITAKYSDFVCDEDIDYYEKDNNRFDWPFLEYKEENFGSFRYEDPEWNFYDEEDEEVEDDGEEFK